MRIDPVVFFRLHLLMVFAGIRSERQVMEQVSDTLAMRCGCPLGSTGDNRDEPLPDHSSLSTIRTRLGLPVFRRFFAVIVAQCARAGLVWGTGLIFDATHTAQRAPDAHAAMDALIPVLRLVVNDHLAALAETKVEEPEEASRWELLEECRLDPEHPPTSYTAACTPSKHGRGIARSFDADYLERVRGYHATEDYQKAMRKRKVWIEPLFGEAKQWHGMRLFRLRGLQKVNMEGLFIAAGQNLKRLLSAKGWGRRPWPDGATSFADISPQTCITLA